MGTKNKTYLALYAVQTYVINVDHASVPNNVITVDVVLKADDNNSALRNAKDAIAEICKRFGPVDRRGDIPSFHDLEKRDVTLLKIIQVDAVKEIFKGPDLKVLAVGRSRDIFTNNN